jgi:hypothetical protein
MNLLDNPRAWLAQERAKARAKLLAEGVPEATVDMLMGATAEMHEEQAACIDRMTGAAPPVEVH